MHNSSTDGSSTKAQLDPCAVHLHQYTYTLLDTLTEFFRVSCVGVVATDSRPLDKTGC
jgi:hypothetical protein